MELALIGNSENLCPGDFFATMMLVLKQLGILRPMTKGALLTLPLGVIYYYPWQQFSLRPMFFVDYQNDFRRSLGNPLLILHRINWEHFEGTQYLALDRRFQQSSDQERTTVHARHGLLENGPIVLGDRACFGDCLRSKGLSCHNLWAARRRGALDGYYMTVEELFEA